MANQIVQKESSRTGVHRAKAAGEQLPEKLNPDSESADESVFAASVGSADDSHRWGGDW